MIRQVFILPLALLATPSLAAEPDADTRAALWCAFAFEQMEPAIRPQDEKAADQFITFAVALKRQLATRFAEEGLTQAEADGVQEQVARQVVGELGDGGTPSHSFEECREIGIAAARAS